MHILQGLMTFVGFFNTDVFSFYIFRKHARMNDTNTHTQTKTGHMTAEKNPKAAVLGCEM